jgi:hypothetical protein
MAIEEFSMLIPAVTVPVWAGQFDKTHPSFDEAAGEETL